jgi:hypothetical protein
MKFTAPTATISSEIAKASAWSIVIAHRRPGRRIWDRPPGLTANGEGEFPPRLRNQHRGNRLVATFSRRREGCRAGWLQMSCARDRDRRPRSCTGRVLTSRLGSTDRRTTSLVAHIEHRVAASVIVEACSFRQPKLRQSVTSCAREVEGAGVFQVPPMSPRGATRLFCGA